MNKEEIKKELIKRYRYIYENAIYILAPLIKEIDNPYVGINKKVIYLHDLPSDIAYLLEEFLLTDKLMEETTYYDFIEEKKRDSEYLISVKEGLSLLDKKNRETFPSLREELTAFNVFQMIRKYISDQCCDLENKEKKLLVLDEYFRISRYSNDSNVWLSGAELEVSDINRGIKIQSGIIKRNIDVYKRNRLDNGIGINNFIDIISNNKFFLSEEEKAQIYFSYHDEIPWYSVISCEDNNDNIDNILPCHSTFYIVENQIFVNNDNYYMLCPNCGHIVKIKKELLTKSSMTKIQERSQEDKDLFRKMILYSELFNLDKKNGFKILKK